MLSRHGSLESAILSALWKLENDGLYKNSVKEVYDYLSSNDDEKRAYTTIKTVMDRLYEKNILLRYKDGRKFYYRTAYSHKEVVVNSIQEIASRYCNGNLNDIAKFLEIMKNERDLISA